MIPPDNKRDFGKFPEKQKFGNFKNGLKEFPKSRKIHQHSNR